MTTPDDIVKYARSWMGTRWVHQGRSKRGIDCAGLLMTTIWKFDLEGEDLQGYRRDPGSEFLEQIQRYTDPVPDRKPVHGAIGVFHDTTMPCHTGIFAVDSKTGEVTVIHSEAFPKRCVHEEDYSIGSVALSTRLVDIRLFRGVDYV